MSSPPVRMPYPKEYVLAQRRRSATPSQIALQPALAGWQKKYAAWLAEQPTVVRVALRLGMARQLSGGLRLSRQALKVLEERPDFRIMYGYHLTGGMEGARERAEMALPKAIDLYAKKVDALNKKIDRDAEGVSTKEVMDVATPALDRVVPKKGEAGAPAAVIVTLTPQQASSIFADPIDVEALPLDTDAETVSS